MISKIFKHLNDWRTLPTYQLERRADLFFASYLEILFKSKLDEEIDWIIPELPIWKGLLTTKQKSEDNSSINVDYAVFTKSRKIYLIELKTDLGSIDLDQVQHYYDATDSGIESVLNGILGIARSKNASFKYNNLLYLLFETKALVRGHNEFIPGDWYENFGEPIFIVPSNTGIIKRGTIIDFETLSRIIRTHGNEIDIAFADSLKKWAVPIGGKSRHPYQPYVPKGSTKLIIGTIPPLRFCDRRKKMNEDDVNFYYGSCDNSFWEIIGEVFKMEFEYLNNELEVKKRKKFLAKQKIGITDIVAECLREGESASDADLKVIKFKNLERTLRENPTIKTLIYTSGVVKTLMNEKFKTYHSISNQDPRINSITIENKQYEVRILYSPSRQALINMGPNGSEKRKNQYKRFLLEG